eukprot:scaffold43441_cov73-Cyclotella_meneghiniana.AAC.1
MGYAGIFMDRGEYAMSDPNPYVDPPNPGATPNYTIHDADGEVVFLDATDRAIIKAEHEAALILWSNHDIVHRVIKEAIDKAVPD